MPIYPPTSTNHDPLAVGGPLTQVAMERPLGQLDAAINAVIAAGSSTSTTLTSQAAAGQKNMVVAARDGWLVGDVFFIGLANGTYESGSIASGTGAGAGTLVAVANLANTYPIGTPVSKSPIEIVQARGTFATLAARLLSFTRLKSALEYGVKADGTTDDTTACQAALDALIGGSISGILFPAGTIRITAALVIGSTAYQYKQIRGMGRGLTVFRQDTSNVNVFQTATEDTHSIDFGGMTLTYNTVQTSANTGAYGICFKRSSGAGIGNGWYFWNVSDLEITKAHIGIGVGGPGATGSLAVWSSHFEQITMAQISMSMIRMVSPATIGMPILTFRQIRHVGNGGVAQAGPAIDAAAAEMQFDGLDIEDWYNRLIYTVGGNPVVIRGLHTERHILNGTAGMFEVSDGVLEIAGSYLMLAVQGGVAALLLRAGAGGLLKFSGARLDCALTSGTINGMSAAAGARTIELGSISDDNSNVPFAAGEAQDFIGPFNPLIVNAAAAWPTANETVLYAFSVKQAVRVGRARIEVGAGAGNVDVGLYDAQGTKLASSGSTVMTVGAGSQQIAFSGGTSVLLLPGRRYYAALVCNGTTATLQSFSMSASGTAGALGIATRVATSFPLPATIAVGTTAAQRAYPICFEP